MRKRRFFNGAGQKRKFYNNLRYFGQTRNLGIALLGLMPFMAIIAVAIFAVIAIANIGHVADHGHFLAGSNLVAAGTLAVARSKKIDFKQRQSLMQKRADLLKTNERMLDIAAQADRDLNAAETSQWEANRALIRQINGQLDESNASIEAAAQREQKRARVPVLPENSPGSGIEVNTPKFNSLGEQLQAIAVFKRTQGANRDPRLIIIGSDEHRNIMAAAGMNESVPSEGGFLVQADLASGLLERVYETGKLLPLCNKIEISSPSNRTKINLVDETSRANGSRFGGVQSFWTNESQTVGATKPKFRQAELVLNKLMAICYATDEMIRDVGVLNSVLNTVFPMEFAFRVEYGIVNGPGNGQPFGFMNSPALIVVNKEAAQAANTILAANIMKMWARMWAPSRATAVWLIDQSIEPQLYQLTITTGSGISTPIYLPPGGLSGNMYGTMFGRPVLPVEYMAALSSQGDIALVDPMQYMVAEKGLMEMAQSMHVNFLTDEMVFRFIMRLDGQPLWNAALTPKSNSGTLSPFVTLQAR